MPGTLVVKPIEANLKKNHDFLKKQDPYCTVYLGSQKVKGEVCRSGGKHPKWKDSITVARNTESTLMIELKDKDTFTEDDLIGVCQVDLNDIDAKNAVSRWYPVYNNKQVAGEILIDINYSPFQQTPSMGNQGAPLQQMPSFGPTQVQQPMMPQQSAPMGQQQQMPSNINNQSGYAMNQHQGYPSQQQGYNNQQQGYSSGAQYGAVQSPQFQQAPNPGMMHQMPGSAPNYNQPQHPQGGMMQGGQGQFY